ncbi:MAG: hypothetical protein LAT61_00720 [Alcanivorax sp.]|nr:hypothetical protein [Alcanivorax sp.]
MRMSLEIDGMPIDAWQVESNELLSGVSTCKVSCVMNVAGLDIEGFPGKAAKLRLESIDGFSRCVEGIVMQIREEAGSGYGIQNVVVCLASRLHRLTQKIRYRIIRQCSVIEIAETLLREHGLLLDDRTAGAFERQDWVAQTGETDFQFLSRLLAREGLWLYSEATERGERIVLADGPRGGARAARRSLHVISEGSGVRSINGHEVVALTRLRRCWRGRPGAARLHRHGCPSSDVPCTKNAGQVDAENGALGGAEDVGFLDGHPDPGVTARRARVRQQRFDSEAYRVLVDGPVADLHPGHLINIAGEGECLVIQATLRGAVPRADQGNVPASLQWSATLQPTRRPYQSPAPERTGIPRVFAARVESAEPYAQLDRMGRRRARIAFDQESLDTAEASPPLRQLQPFNTRPGEDGQPAGWDWPLRNGAEVLMTCLNDDPDQPLILGYSPCATQVGPVNGVNRSQYRVLTPAGHQMSLDDLKQAEAITLHTPEGHCMLRLDADSELPLVRLACQQGGLALRAGKSMRTQVGGEVRAVIGEGQSTVVGENIQYTSENGIVHFQSATRIKATAERDYRAESGENMQLAAGNQMTMRAEENVSVTSTANIAASMGADLHIQANGRLEISGSGGGDITLYQGSGGITVKADGTVRLFGKSVTITDKG